MILMVQDEGQYLVAGKQQTYTQNKTREKTNEGKPTDGGSEKTTQQIYSTRHTEKLSRRW